MLVFTPSADKEIDQMLQYVDDVNYRAHRLRIDFENAKQVLPEPSPEIESANHSNIDVDKRMKRRLKRQQAKYQQDRYYLQQQLFYLVKQSLRIGDYQSDPKKDRHRCPPQHMPLIQPTPLLSLHPETTSPTLPTSPKSQRVPQTLMPFLHLNTPTKLQLRNSSKNVGKGRAIAEEVNEVQRERQWCWDLHYDPNLKYDESITTSMNSTTRQRTGGGRSSREEKIHRNSL